MIYQWKGLYEDVAEYCKTCQGGLGFVRRSHYTLHGASLSFGKVRVDFVYVPESAEGFKYIVLARDDLSGWVEGRAIVNNSAATVAKFLFKDVITDARNGTLSTADQLSSSRRFQS